MLTRLYDEKPCFLCNTPNDAMSVTIAGAGKCNAISLTDDEIEKKFIKTVKNKKPNCPLILSFGVDYLNSMIAQSTATELRSLSVPFVIAKYTLEAYPEEKGKSPNDFFNSNREQFKSDINANLKDVENVVNSEKRAALEKINENSGAIRLKGFLDGIKESVNTPSIPTGFKELDNELDGGLYAGLYILGAISSLGKTTLLLQIADQIAEQEYDVLYFSLEMAANELISKSISRLTYLNCNGFEKNAKTARGITTASRYKSYSRTEKMLIRKAIDDYDCYAKNLYFFEGIGDIGAEQIRQKVDDHKNITGKTPVVFVDYLQILAPHDVRASDKQSTDKAVLELKRISRDFKTPVFAISSFNRDNYTNEVSMSAFKESGAIEYGSDVLMALQPQGMQPGNTKTEQKENIELVKRCKRRIDRQVEAVVLKNRNGRTGGKVGFIYRSLFNLFEIETSYIPEEDSKDDDVPFGSNSYIY